MSRLLQLQCTDLDRTFVPSGSVAEYTQVRKRVSQLAEHPQAESRFEGEA